ncbi:MAG: hypothetical protein P8046_03370 [Anaerolineales bacterium]
MTISNGSHPKKYLIQAVVLIALLSLIISACSQSNTGSEETEIAPQPTSAEMITDPEVQAAIAALSDQYQIDSNTVSFVEKQPVEWPDSCLGVDQPGIMCAMHVVDGYRITLSVSQETYEVHTNTDGSQTVLVPGPIPTTTGVSFTKMGENTCQTFIFSENLEVSFGPCGSDLDPFNVEDYGRANELAHYISTFQSFTLNTSDGFLNFVGTGSQQSSPAEKQSILNWAQLTFNELQTGTENTSDLNNGLILTWHREGGIAGFCNDLSIYATGKVIATDCKNDASKLVGEDWLNKDQIAQILRWEENFAWFEYSPQTNATADAMQIYLNFNGNGDVVSESDKQTVANFAQDIYNEIASLNTFIPSIESGIWGN